MKEELTPPQLPKDFFKPLPKLSFSLSTVVSVLIAAYLFGSINPIQNYIPIEVNRTEESISIEWNFR